MVKLEQTASQRNYAIGRHEQVVLIQWTDVASESAVRDLSDAFALSKHPSRKLQLFVYLEEQALSGETPDGFRQSLARCLKDWGDEIVGSAIIFEKTGFKGAVLRAIVSGVGLMSRTKFPATVHPSIEKAAEWMSQLDSARHLESRDVARMLREFQRSVVERLRVA